jgi:hypothetical protein
MAISSENRETLLELLSDLTPAHVSTLVASLSHPQHQIGTATDSESFTFLQTMAELGLAEEVPLEVDMPAEILAVLRSFSVNEAGRRELEALLKAASPGSEQ